MPRPIPAAERMALRARAAALYLDGCTIRSIADQIGRPYTTTYALLDEAGIKFRPRGRGHTSSPAGDR